MPKKLRVQRMHRNYRLIIERIHQGQGYYEAAKNALHVGNYPTASVFNWRLPFLSRLLAYLPTIEMARMLGIGLALITLIFWISVLEGYKFSFLFLDAWQLTLLTGPAILSFSPAFLFMNFGQDY